MSVSVKWVQLGRETGGSSLYTPTSPFLRWACPLSAKEGGAALPGRAVTPHTHRKHICARVAPNVGCWWSALYSQVRMSKKNAPCICVSAVASYEQDHCTASTPPLPLYSFTLNLLEEELLYVRAVAVLLSSAPAPLREQLTGSHERWARGDTFCLSLIHI